MDKTELSKIIDANISKIYKKYQDANQIETGDISPEDDLKLAVIKKSLANLIMGICDPEGKNNILNPVRKRILDQVSNAYSTNFMGSRYITFRNILMYFTSSIPGAIGNRIRSFQQKKTHGKKQCPWQ